MASEGLRVGLRGLMAPIFIAGLFDLVGRLLPLVLPGLELAEGLRLGASAEESRLVCAAPIHLRAATYAAAFAESTLVSEEMATVSTWKL